MVCLLSRKMAKIPMKNNVIFVMTVIDLLVKTLKPLFFCSHFTKDQWLKFIDYEISGLTLKDEAYFMNTSITTCFYMRHKLYKAASQIIQEQKLSDEIEIDSQYLSINLKGTKLENMPRYSKKRGKQSAYRGISHHKVCVTCAIDSQDNIMMNIVWDQSHLKNTCL